MHHKEEQHDAIVAQAERRYGKRQALQGSKEDSVNITDAAKRAANATQSSNKLLVKDKLKEVLCSRLMISNNDPDDICNKICGQGND